MFLTTKSVKKQKRDVIYGNLKTKNKKCVKCEGVLENQTKKIKIKITELSSA